jgi:uncharacterized protein YecE (DUF72 family)
MQTSLLAQVPGDFRFVVKAPGLVTDALRRDSSGRGMERNRDFLNAEAALKHFVEPALEGLGPKLGTLLFQISPLSPACLTRMPEAIAAPLYPPQGAARHSAYRARWRHSGGGSRSSLADACVRKDPA